MASLAGTSFCDEWLKTFPRERNNKTLKMEVHNRGETHQYSPSCHTFQIVLWSWADCQNWLNQWSKLVGLSILTLNMSIAVDLFISCLWQGNRMFPLSFHYFIGRICCSKIWNKICKWRQLRYWLVSKRWSTTFLLILQMPQWLEHCRYLSLCILRNYWRNLNSQQLWLSMVSFRTRNHVQKAGLFQSSPDLYFHNLLCH